MAELDSAFPPQRDETVLDGAPGGSWGGKEGFVMLDGVGECSGSSGEY